RASTAAGILVRDETCHHEIDEDEPWAIANVDWPDRCAYCSRAGIEITRDHIRPSRARSKRMYELLHLAYRDRLAIIQQQNRTPPACYECNQKLADREFARFSDRLLWGWRHRECPLEAHLRGRRCDVGKTSE